MCGPTFFLPTLSWPWPVGSVLRLLPHYIERATVSGWHLQYCVTIILVIIPAISTCTAGGGRAPPPAGALRQCACAARARVWSVVRSRWARRPMQLQQHAWSHRLLKYNYGRDGWPATALRRMRHRCAGWPPLALESYPTLPLAQLAAVRRCHRGIQ